MRKSHPISLEQGYTYNVNVPLLLGDMKLTLLHLMILPPLDITLITAEGGGNVLLYHWSATKGSIAKIIYAGTKIAVPLDAIEVLSAVHHALIHHAPTHE